MPAATLLNIATLLLVLAALGGLLMVSIRWLGHRNPPRWLALGHGLLALLGLSTLICAVALGGGPRVALWAIGLLLMAAIGGVVLNLLYHRRGLLLPAGFTFAHLTLAATGLGLLLSHVGGFNEQARISAELGFGPSPQLPPPDPRLLPTVRIATAVGWAADAKPIAAAGFAVQAFARGLDHPRWLLELPNGDVLVAESNAPARPQDATGIKGWVAQRMMEKAGAAVPSANRISLLRDADGDGVAELKTEFLSGLNSPFGMALVGGTLFVANTDAVLAFDWTAGATRLTGPGRLLVELPAGPINHHWTKGLIASPNGRQLYVTVGSNSNVGENGMDQEIDRAAILEIDIASGARRPFATGLRNPNGLAWQPDSGQLWTTVNERDEIGSDLVPDFLTSVQDGAFYGWPYSYYGAHVDVRVQPPRPDLVEKAVVPDYALGTHTASLGLAFYQGALFPERYRHGAFIGQHGSWNRNPPSGYKVIFIPFHAGRPNGAPEDVLTGFLDAEGNAQGRPVGVVVDYRGALLVADDVGNVVWRVTASE